MFLSAVLTLILTAPIHCRGSIGEQVSKSVLIKNYFYILDDLRVNFQCWVNYSFKQTNFYSKWAYIYFLDLLFYLFIMWALYCSMQHFCGSVSLGLITFIAAVLI